MTLLVGYVLVLSNLGRNFKMKRILFTFVFILLCAVGSFAQNAVTFMPLVQSPQFLSRVTYQIVLAAPVIETEAALTGGSAACHTARAQLAAQVMKYPTSFTSTFAIALVTSSQVTSGTVTGTLVAGNLDSSATDAALFSATNAAWSSVAGCITVP